MSGPPDGVGGTIMSATHQPINSLPTLLTSLINMLLFRSFKEGSVHRHEPAGGDLQSAEDLQCLRPDRDGKSDDKIASVF